MHRRVVKFAPEGSLPHLRPSSTPEETSPTSSSVWSRKWRTRMCYALQKALAHTSCWTFAFIVVLLVYVLQQHTFHPSTDESMGTTARSPSTGLDGQSNQFHVVFSSGCSGYQQWQSELFFYAAYKAGQPGLVTRIVSGCEASENDIRRLFDERIRPMAPERFRIHFTPNFRFHSDMHDNSNYPFFNKPFGMKHFLEQGMGLPANKEIEDQIIVLMDPDMIILKPFARNNFSDVDFVRAPDVTSLEHGTPMAQRYSFGIRWLDFGQRNMQGIVPGEPSPVMELSEEEAWAGYVVGPPYLATSRDMYNIVLKWCEFVPRVRHLLDATGDFMAEMYAYVLSAAHQKLPHSTTPSLMVSDVESYLSEEGWRGVDSIPADSVCNKQQSPADLPYVIHYCQRYWVGDYFFGKRRLPQDFFSCETPLLAEPPLDAAVRYDYGHLPGNLTKPLDPKTAKRSAFLVCNVLRLLNEAAIYFKQRQCAPDTANLDRTLFLNRVEDFHFD